MSQHRDLALWAADCAERVLALFESDCPDDGRPRQAIEAARRWHAGDLSIADARTSAFASHAAAREAPNTAAVAAARAAGHAAAAAHVTTHAPHAADYACKATAAAGLDADLERLWQIDRLPEPLRHLLS